MHLAFDVNIIDTLILDTLIIDAHIIKLTKFEDKYHVLQQAKNLK